jgi:hypothetical protein
LTDHIHPGDWIAGPFWEAPVQVITRRERSDHDLVAVNATHLERSRAYVLTHDDWDQVQRVARADYGEVGFTGDPTRFRLGIDAHRLRLAHSIDPYAALNASRIDPLPHQFEAVYERLLARPVVRALLARDRRFLTQGLTGLAAHWNDAALEAFGEGEVDPGSELTDRATAAQQRLDDLEDQLERAAEFSAGHLLLTAPEVLGVALVIPTPLEVEIEGEDGPERVLMRRDDEVEEAAMEAVMRYEARQGRHPRDVHVGNSWDIESDDEQERVVRYIEVNDVVTMTGPEWEAARRLGDRHWLYIVRLSDEMLVMIQNPFSKLKPRELKRWLVSVTEAKGHGETDRLNID